MLLSCVVDPGDLDLAGLLRSYTAAEIWAGVQRGSPAAWAGRAHQLDHRALDLVARVRRIRFVVPGDDEWPEQVAALAVCQPVQGLGGEPVGLWLRGPLRLPSYLDRAVAVVGSRASSAYGESVAADLGAGLAESGFTTVSGGAYGIDAAAHQGAIAAEGVTICLQAGGVDKPYPVGNARLFDRLVADHLLVAEAPPGAHPSRYGFLARNRLIAALAQGTVVVEAAVRSGARNTATWASNLGRYVMAVPGPVTAPTSATAHSLIRSGAAVLVTSATDVLQQVNPVAAEPPHILERSALDELTREEKAVFEAFPATGTRTPAELAIGSGVTYPACLGALAVLQDRGLVGVAKSGEWRLRRPGKTPGGQGRLAGSGAEGGRPPRMGAAASHARLPE